MVAQRTKGGGSRYGLTTPGFYVLVILLAVVLIATPVGSQKNNRNNKNKNKGGGNKEKEDALVEEEEVSTGPPLTGDPQIDYIHDPNLPHELMGYSLADYPFYKRVPKSPHNFTCDDRLDGFYASVPHKCQVYYNCLFNQRYDFLCPNYTVFDQVNFICNYVSEVDCDNSERYYDRNKELYVTTTTTTPSPRIIYVDRDRPRRPNPRPLRPISNRRPQINRRRPSPPARPPPQQPVNSPDTQDDPSLDSPAYYDDYYDDYYYYDDAPSTATTTTTTQRPLRRRINRPAGGGGGRRRVDDRNRGGQRRRRPGPGGGGRRRRVKTTTTTEAPVEYYDDYYYDDYYDDDTANKTPEVTPAAPQEQQPKDEPIPRQNQRIRSGQGRRPSFRRPQAADPVSDPVETAITTSPPRRQFKSLRSQSANSDNAVNQIPAPETTTLAVPDAEAITEAVDPATTTVANAAGNRRRRVQVTRRQPVETQADNTAQEADPEVVRSPGAGFGGRRPNRNK